MFKYRLAEAMEKRELKATDLVKKTGIPKSTLSNYLTGRMEPKHDRLHDLAVALNVQEAWLMGYDVSMERPTTGDEYAAETIKMLRQLTPEQQEIVTKLLEQMLSKE